MQSDDKLINLSTKEKIFIFSPLIAVILVVSIFIKTGNNEDYYQTDLHKDSYKGLVIYKFRNFKNHGAGEFTLQDKDSEFIFYSDDWINLYDSCSIGDSIIKNFQEKHILLYKSQTKKFIRFEFNRNRSGFTFMKRFEL